MQDSYTSETVWSVPNELLTPGFEGGVPGVE